ncbi:hypothetical protein ABEB36_013691 [Hypothenemus hampei]|uniref:Uncharacterized protein n=1 Tax=Hypothenemus hampei TaxID=57062 RepID=A0ABD1E4Z6_HYPHA
MLTDQQQLISLSNPQAPCSSDMMINQARCSSSQSGISYVIPPCILPFSPTPSPHGVTNESGYEVNNLPNLTTPNTIDFYQNCLHPEVKDVDEMIGLGIQDDEEDQSIQEENELRILN